MANYLIICHDCSQPIGNGIITKEVNSLTEVKNTARKHLHTRQLKVNTVRVDNNIKRVYINLNNYQNFATYVKLEKK